MTLFDIQPYPAFGEAERSLTNFYDDLINDRICKGNGDTVATSVACTAVRGNITHALRQYFTGSVHITVAMVMWKETRERSSGPRHQRAAAQPAHRKFEKHTSQA